MSYPSDISLPTNAKYFAFVDHKLSYNPHWDITWSFTYALSAKEAGISTFLTNFLPTTGFPGQYLGYSGNANLSSYITDENGNYILTENGEKLLVEGETGIGPNGILAIGLDSTGLFALSSSTRGGVGISNIRPYSLIIRNSDDNVVVNTQLSALNSEFLLLSSGGFNYQTLRFRYSKAGEKLSIDFKRSSDTKFKLLTSINYSFVYPDNFSDIRVGFCFCSPISSSSISAGTLKLKNFHTQGNVNDVSHEFTLFTPITAAKLTNYTTLSSLTSLM